MKRLPYAGKGMNAGARKIRSISPAQSDGVTARPALITGGAGFVGTNLARRLLAAGTPVIIFDNLSRSGVERNLLWLRENFKDGLQVEVSDIRDRKMLHRAVQQAGQVFHFAAQVAVTTSLTTPMHDFEVNLQGTLNLLEEIRALSNPPSLVFTSTNKVYGGIADLLLRCNGLRYEPVESAVARKGIGEEKLLDFHSPYGCSKGAADQYILDYARTYGISAAVFRMSCIYGPHQFGTEDQGWVAHFLISAVENQPITLYGDGKQVRDILFVDDLVDAFLLAQTHMHAISGQAFNIGGGPENTISLLELLELIRELNGKVPVVRFDEWRAADQRYYVSNITKFSEATGWNPQVRVADGVRRLHDWLLDSRLAGAPATLQRM